MYEKYKLLKNMSKKFVYSRFKHNLLKKSQNTVKI